MATLASDFAPDEDPANPNIVKLITNQSGRAIYFSRSLIPFDRDRQGPPAVHYLKHPGLYAYRRDFLLKYVTLPATPLEKIEQLEQLRAIEHGYAIAVVKTEVRHHGIDTRRSNMRRLWPAAREGWLELPIFRITDSRFEDAKPQAGLGWAEQAAAESLQIGNRQIRKISWQFPPRGPLNPISRRGTVSHAHYAGHPRGLRQ